MTAKKDSILTVEAYREMIEFDNILRTQVYREDGNGNKAFLKDLCIKYDPA